MRRLSASDAISPAWKHTQRLLFPTRDWRLLFKIGLVACFANLGGFNFGLPLNGLGGPHRGAGAAGAALAGGLLIAGLVFFVLSLVLFYIGSRLQFVLFEMVLREDTRVGPIWRRYGGVVWRWIGLKLLLLLVFLVCLVPLLVPMIFAFVNAAKTQGGQAIHPGAIIGGLLGFLLVFFLFAVVFAIVFILLVDFGLPSMALEATSIAETVRRVWALLRAEIGQVLLYVLLRFALVFAGAIVGEFALFFAILILAIPLGGTGWLLYSTLHQASGAGYAAMIAGLAALGLIFLAILFLVATMVLGTVYVFAQAYALYFLGGRYPRLGEYLEPSVTYPFTPPPPLAGPDEDGDDDGPDLPLNPALA